jgi:hypothetical protein
VLQGSQLIGGVARGAGQKTFRTYEPHSGTQLDPAFKEATSGEVAEAVARGAACAADLRGRRQATSRGSSRRSPTDSMRNTAI